MTSLDDWEGGISIGGVKISNIRFDDNTKSGSSSSRSGSGLNLAYNNKQLEYVYWDNPSELFKSLK